MSSPRTRRVGLALGSGSARGWAHVGVIRALEEAGIRPDVVCGTSVGALVGAAYAAGELGRFERWVLGLGLKEVVAYMDVGLGGGLLKGERLTEFFRDKFVDRPLEELATPFAAVATSLRTGEEVWLRQGSTIEAVRASLALPGLFSPVLWEGELVVDGGLVNPVPVSLTRAMGAEIVIAVDLSSDILGRHLSADLDPDLPDLEVADPETPNSEAADPDPPAVGHGDWVGKLRGKLAALVPSHSSDTPEMPSVSKVLASSINIMQVRIARSRMAKEPPDLVVAPRLAHLGLLDFHRAKEAIEEGERAVERVLHELPPLRDRAS